MAALSVSLGSRSYDGVMPIVRGEVSIPGVELRMKLDNNVPRLFSSLFQGESDVSEMSLAELIYYTSRDKVDFVGIPVFPSRVFRHAFLFCNPSAGVNGPRDLAGRKIGFQRWVQTAGVWMRGMLVEDYGVSPQAVQWYITSAHHWEDSSEEAVEPRDGSEVRHYTTASSSDMDVACRALLEGEVDVIGITENQAPLLVADGRARRLFHDYRAEEVAYYQRTRIFPIMHVLAMKKSLVAARPDLPAQLFNLFCQSKKLAQAAIRPVPSWSFAWKDYYQENEGGIFKGDPWAFGLAANQHVVDKFAGYCYQQGIAAQQVGAKELFVPSTWDLQDG